MGAGKYEDYIDFQDSYDKMNEGINTVKIKAIKDKIADIRQARADALDKIPDSEEDKLSKVAVSYDNKIASLQKEMEKENKGK